MKLIDKDAYVAEIEKRLKETESMQPKFDQFRAGQISAFKGAIKIIDTLEVKEVNLEEEIQVFALLELWPLKIYDANVGISIAMQQLYQCAKHFFELGLKAKQG